jgi:cytochrome c oxidase assembly protein subunit 15
VVKAKLRHFALGLLTFGVVIILWGAWVRISGSGDGCGKHWPLCHGELFPSGSWYHQLQTWIEFAHRAKSGLFGILVFLHSWLVWRWVPTLRGLALATSLFTIAEALLGAILVLGGYVDTNDSLGRTIIIACHLGNTLLLIGSITCLWAALADNAKAIPIRQLIKQLRVPFLIMFLIATTGAWAALSSTLFPSNGLAEGLIADFSSTSHFLIRIRIMHPLVAIIGTYYLWRWRDSKIDLLSNLLFLQLLCGLFTLILHGPVVLKIFHLLMAQLLWIGLVKESSTEKI